jgi:hypothetical protein
MLHHAAMHKKIREHGIRGGKTGRHPPYQGSAISAAV